MQNCSNSGKPEMAIPSQAWTADNAGREGVETRRAAPTARRQGEGIVQTTNAACMFYMQAWRRRKPQMARKSVGPQGLWGFESPRPHHFFSLELAPENS